MGYSPTQVERVGQSPTLSRGLLLSVGYGSTVMVQTSVASGAVGRRSLLLTEPSPLGSVDPLTAGLPSPSTQSISDAVPPCTCESTDTLTLVSGVLWKLTFASLPSPQVDSAVTLASFTSSSLT